MKNEALFLFLILVFSCSKEEVPINRISSDAIEVDQPDSEKSTTTEAPFKQVKATDETGLQPTGAEIIHVIQDSPALRLDSTVILSTSDNSGG